MPNPNLGPDYALAQTVGRMQRQLAAMSTAPLLLNASTGQTPGQPGLSTDAGGLHCFDSTGKEVVTLSASTGELESAGDNGNLRLAANYLPPGGSQTVPALVMTWDLSGTTQTAPGLLYSYENRVGIQSPSQSTVGATSNLSVSDDSWALSNSAGAYVQGLDTGAWSLASSGVAAAYVQGNRDGSWTLGQAGNGPATYSTPGPDGTAVLAGGTANGSVNLVAHGTGNVQVTGNTVVSGTFSATGTKAFLMPHPLDPAKLLMHASTESDRNGVEYWGSVTTGADGTATVTLPAYFEALTKTTGRNIQLTPTGPTSTPPWASPITAGTFTIHAPAGTPVDWLVKAERQQVVNGADVLAFEAEQAAPATQTAPAVPAAPTLNPTS